MNKLDKLVEWLWSLNPGTVDTVIWLGIISAALLGAPPFLYVVYIWWRYWFS